jgi:hypothetical protein
VVFYNLRGTAEQYIKEGKNAIKWPRLSCRTMRGNAVRLQLHALVLGPIWEMSASMLTLTDILGKNLNYFIIYQ